ncbi:ML domain-containing protein [Kitasatospora purpeofusca]|uniref:ML domain-containing protein n=1 Tax=Kitasatospora purpeofusca TaxID=67352 RepID=UPI0038676961
MPSWTNSGTPADSFSVDNVTYTPDPPVKGKDLTVTLTGTLAAPITGGTITTKLKYGIITVVNESAPLDAAAAGSYSPQTTISLTQDMPSGSYAGNVSLVDQDSIEIASVNITFHV